MAAAACTAAPSSPRASSRQASNGLAGVQAAVGSEGGKVSVTREWVTPQQSKQAGTRGYCDAGCLSWQHAWQIEDTAIRTSCSRRFRICPRLTSELTAARVGSQQLRRHDPKTIGGGSARRAVGLSQPAGQQPQQLEQQRGRQHVAPCRAALWLAAQRGHAQSVNA